MLFPSNILRRRLMLTPPDYQESRGNQRLLVWGGLPHWMIIDEELHQFLARFDGQTPFGAHVKAAAGAPRELTSLAADLLKLGVLRDPAKPTRAAPFLEPEKLIALAARARHMRLTAIVSTNGALITPDLARNLGVNEARFIPLKMLGGATASGLRPALTSALINHACSLFKRRPEFLALLGRDALSILANTCRYSARRFSCGTGRQTVLLDSNGALYPCLNMTDPRFMLASIRDQGCDFQRIWRESKMLEKLREETKVENPARVCSRCPVRHWCLGGCRGEAFALNGDASLPSPYCADLRRAMLNMMWLLTESPELIRPALKIC